MTRRYKKKSSRQKKILVLDTIFSLYIRARDGQRCCTLSTQCAGNITCGHLFTRGAKSTRWDERFAFAQCAGHNCLHEHRPEIMTAWFIQKYGKELYLEGSRLTQQPKKWQLSELDDLINYYKKKYEQQTK